jgi:hypothetical protein
MLTDPEDGIQGQRGIPQARAGRNVRTAEPFKKAVED